MKDQKTITVKVKILTPLLGGRAVPREAKVIMDKNERTVDSLLTKLHESCRIPREEYNKHLGKSVSVFRGCFLLKNGRRIGYFDNHGFKPGRGSDLSIEDGDSLIILFAVGAG